MYGINTYELTGSKLQSQQIHELTEKVASLEYDFKEKCINLEEKIDTIMEIIARMNNLRK